MSLCRIIGLLIVTALIAGGCGSSLVDPGGTSTNSVFDGGVDDILDASDDRRIPSTCTLPAECDDGDPCTNQTCTNGACEYWMKIVEITLMSIVTSAPAFDVAIAPGFVYAAEGDAGVEVFDINGMDDPSVGIQVVGTLNTAGTAIAVDSDERGLVVAEGEAGIETFSSPDMRLRAHVQPGDERLRGMDEIVAVGIGPQYSIASAYSDGVLIMDLRNLGNPIGIKELDTPGRAVNAASGSDTSGLVADSLTGAIAVNFQTEEGPVLRGKIPSNGRAVDVAVSGDTALVAEYGAGLSIVDLSDPDHPERLARLPSASPIVSVSLLGPQTGIVAQEDGQITIYDLRDPLKPAVLTTWTASSKPYEIDSSDGLVAVALGDNGVALLKTGCSPSP